MSEWMEDIAFAVLFGLLRRKSGSKQWEKAFRKLFNYIGFAYGWTTVPAEEAQKTLPRE